MTEPVGLIVRVLHILCGVFWAGAAMMIAGFIEPSVRALGPDGGKFIQRMMGPGRFPVFMTSAGSITVLSGLSLLWMGSGPRLGDWLLTGYGRSIVAGSAAGLWAMVIGLSVNAPTAKRMAALSREMQAKGGPPSDEQRAELTVLQKRMHIAGRASALLLILSVVAMAAAHYL
jgi:hypothetical protein